MTSKPNNIIFAITWQFLTAFLWFIGLIAAIIFAYPFSPGYQGSTSVEVGDVFGMVIGTLFILGAITIAIVSGVGLTKRKPWGRFISMLNTGISLILVPVGTIVGIFILIYLQKSEVREYYQTSLG